MVRMTPRLLRDGVQKGDERSALVGLAQPERLDVPDPEKAVIDRLEKAARR